MVGQLDPDPDPTLRSPQASLSQISGLFALERPDHGLADVNERVDRFDRFPDRAPSCSECAALPVRQPVVPAAARLADEIKMAGRQHPVEPIEYIMIQ